MLNTNVLEKGSNVDAGTQQQQIEARDLQFPRVITTIIIIHLGSSS